MMEMRSTVRAALRSVFPTMIASLFVCVCTAALVRSVGAQSSASPADSVAVIAVADSALARITRRDFVGLTDLMTPDAIIGAVSERGTRAGYRSRTREQERAATSARSIVERGFGASARVSGPVAMVWLPYDLYVDAKWSHCGVDVFTLVRTDGTWRIATLVYSVDQPPSCAAHPDGPPR